MFSSWRKVVSLFPLYCPFSPVAYVPSFGCRRYYCQVSEQFILDFSVACETSGSIFHFVASEEFNQCGLN